MYIFMPDQSHIIFLLCAPSGRDLTTIKLRRSCYITMANPAKRGVAIQLAVSLDHHGAGAPRDDGG